jgi:hypothetical protein
MSRGALTNVSWCGIFALWVLREAKITDLKWEWGFGFCHRLPVTRTPKRGDIAYIHRPAQHHAIVVDIQEGTAHNGLDIETVDGNVGGGRVQRKTRREEVFTSFYSISPLIELSRPLVIDEYASVADMPPGILRGWGTTVQIPQPKTEQPFSPDSMTIFPLDETKKKIE